jgi:ATP diphosphatase
MDDISDLLDIMKRLRDPEQGCSWDRAQDLRSIAPHTIEEAYELADAIERDAVDELPGELGDLLFHIVFYAQIAAESGLFTFADVVTAICSKMLRRHPHVFAGEALQSTESLGSAWEAIKRQEKGDAANGVLHGIPDSLPALTRAAKLGRRAASVGFDWSSLPPVRDKVNEELAELDVAIADGANAEIEAEIGDVLFAVTNLCRHLGIDPEQSLRGANSRFESRFAYVEKAVATAAVDWSGFDAEALESLWQAAKNLERPLE